MPWKTNDVMNLKMEFVVRAKRGEQSFRSLCREYGISAKTGYKWIKRNNEEPLVGLMERSRRPLGHAWAVGVDEVLDLVELKLAHPKWGPKKIRVLQERLRGRAPSLSTVNRVLDRAGLVERRRKRKVWQTGRLVSAHDCQGPNDVWTVDFKGSWRTAERARCEPLTVRDQYSRYVLAAEPLKNAQTDCVRLRFESLFTEYGLPRVIHSDNGVPFACAQGLLGLTRLSVWWIALGIDLDRSRPAHPQDNGAHERMHLDVAREVEYAKRGTLVEHRRYLELWREEYNQVRPHEALRNRTPSQVYQKSERPYAGTPAQIVYHPSSEVRRVNHLGVISYAGDEYYISAALSGWDIALRPSGALYEVRFAKLHLGYIDLRTRSFRGAASRSPEAPLINT
jgi:transposase InsO family protein